MKKILMIAAVAGIGLATFAGCKKSSSSPSNTMAATINSKSFSGSNCVATISSGTLIVETGVTGTTALTFPSMNLFVSNYTGAGTYTIASTNSSIFEIDSSSSANALASAFAGGSGTLTVTAASTTAVSGTFNFTCSDGTTITGGSFTATVD